MAGEEFWSRASKAHEELALGSTVMVKTQRGPTKDTWEFSGPEVNVLVYNSYLVRMDGSGHLNKRRRSFLKSLVTFKAEQHAPGVQEW